MQPDFDVLIIGGGPAGLSAAMSLGRMSRTALICDDNRPRNAPAEHMNNFPSHDGLNPQEWRKTVLRDLEKYRTLEFFKGSVLKAERVDGLFVAQLSGQASKSFRKIILAHGVDDRLPAIPGLKELWGKAVYHCPYCHGFEVRGTSLGLVANGFIAEHMLPMIYSLSQDILLFTQGPADISADLRGHLARRKVRLMEERIVSLAHDGNSLRKIILESGEEITRDGLFWAPILPFALKSDIGEKLGCERSENGLYKVNDFNRTSVPGVFAAGDISQPKHSVIGAAAAGQFTGAAVVSELVSEDFSL